jgi:hypothetical protein
MHVTSNSSQRGSHTPETAMLNAAAEILGRNNHFDEPTTKRK